MRTADLCRAHGIRGSDVLWLEGQVGGLDVSEAQQLGAMEDENRRLKDLVADLSLNQEALNG